MPADKRSRNTLISCIGFGSILAVFAVVGYFPCWNEARQLKRDIHDRQAAIADSARQASDLKEATRHIQLIHLPVYDRLVPANKDFGAFLEELSHELDSAGMQETAVRALQATSLRHCEQLPIEVRGTGTFAQVHDFLTRLESLNRMSSVTRLNIESDTTMTGRVAMELTLSIYNTKSN